MAKKKLTQKEVQIKYGYRSGLEVEVANQIFDYCGHIQFEPKVIKFIQPAKHRKYTPDFILPNGIIVETKGRFVLADRQKHLWIKQQYSDLDIRFVFSNPKALLRKGAKSNYADWCEKNNFKYAKGLIPQEWFDE